MVPPPAPDSCTDVGPGCPVEGTVYGYAPSLGANVFFAAFFGICLLAQLFQGIRWRTWTFMIGLTLGCFGELIGYIGRVIMHNNAYSSIGFQIQICCLIISPAFMSGAIYLTLKHLVISFGQEYSRLKPNLYTYIFISADIFSLVLQGAGGGTAATADPDSNLLDIGTDLMLAGIIFQVVVLAFFGAITLEYAFRVYRHRNNLSSFANRLAISARFRCFVGAIFVAYLAILVRCIYRIPEMSGGWRNPIMRNEAEFIVLEGVMIVIAVAALTIFHPGYCFPALADSFGAKRPSTKAPSEESGDEMMARV